MWNGLRCLNEEVSMKAAVLRERTVGALETGAAAHIIFD